MPRPDPAAPRLGRAAVGVDQSPGALRTVAGVVLAAVTTALVGGGCAGETVEREEAARRLAAEAPTLWRAAPLAGVSDLGQLSEPSHEIRDAMMTQSMVYRVIDATRDSAQVAVWQRTRSTHVPEGIISAVCVEVEGGPGLTTRAITVRCPHRLSPHMPSSDVPGWGRDAESRAAAEAARIEVDFALWWMLARNTDGTQPRTEPRELADLTAAIAQTDRWLNHGPEPITVVLDSLAGQDHNASGRLRVNATAVDQTNVRATTTTAACFTFEVDLDARPDDRQTWHPTVRASC